jgi:hypothetical protein
VIGAQDASVDVGRPVVDASESGRPEDAHAEGDAAKEEAAGPPPCDPSGLAGILVAELGDTNKIDPLGFPTYAIDGCTLAYVSRPAQGPTYGPLLVRDLATKQDTPIVSSMEQPRRPTLAGGVLAWEATEGGVSVVRVQYKGQINTVTGPFDHAGEPHAITDAVVFTAWLGPDDAGDTDVYQYSPSTGNVMAVATGPGQQRFATISPSFVAFTDFSEDPAGSFAPDQYRASDIGVVDRGTLTKTLRHLAGAQGFPMLDVGSIVAYVDYEMNPPFDPTYRVFGGDIAADPSADVNLAGAALPVSPETPWVRPAAGAGLIVWIDVSLQGCEGLVGHPFDLSQGGACLLFDRNAIDPVTGSVLTVVATHMGNTPLYSLAGVAR